MSVAAKVLDAVLDRTVVPGYTRLGYAVRSRFWPADPAPDALEGCVVLVTGMNSDLGKAAVVGLARLGATVHMLVNDLEEGERGRLDIAEKVPDAHLELEECDLADLRAVHEFAERFLGSHGSLDVLVHNAGALPPDQRPAATVTDSAGTNQAAAETWPPHERDLSRASEAAPANTAAPANAVGPTDTGAPGNDATDASANAVVGNLGAAADGPGAGEATDLGGADEAGVPAGSREAVDVGRAGVGGTTGLDEAGTAAGKGAATDGSAGPGEDAIVRHVLGPFLLTGLLRPALAAAKGRVVFVTSGAAYTHPLRGDDARLAGGEHGGKGDGRIKRMQVVLAEQWAHRLADDGVVVHSAQPGWAEVPGVTALVPGADKVVGSLLRTPEQAADTVVWVAAADEPGRSNGHLWQDRAIRPTHYLPWQHDDPRSRKDLWDLCERETGLPI
ncbi:SDR family NAD(P)-dependent oxidoreductase [Actinokineospora iranica]|nr:SDR family NAD(P)-dependent oxidoreductase [Actinokineospora iranica]